MYQELRKTAYAVLAVTAATGLFSYKNAGSGENESPLTPIDAKEIKLPAGFTAKILATDLGTTRHIAVGKSGDIYVKLAK